MFEDVTNPYEAVIVMAQEARRINEHHLKARSILNRAMEQAEELVFAQINCMLSPRTLELAETLLPLMPEGIDCFFFANSGAEANEGAVKLAKTGAYNMQTAVNANQSQMRPKKSK